MSILDWIEKTRERPERTRYKIAFTVTVLILSLIIAVWLTIFIASKEIAKSRDNSYKSPVSIIKEVFD